MQNDAGREGKTGCESGTEGFLGTNLRDKLRLKSCSLGTDFLSRNRKDIWVRA